MKNEYITLKNINNLYDLPCRIMFPDATPTDLLIMCHGFSSSKDSRSINILSEVLTKNNILCVSFDFPEHGENHANPKYFTIKNCLTDLDCVIKFAKDKFPNLPLSIFGISFSGFIGLSKVFKNDTTFKRRIFRALAIDMESVFKNVLLKEIFWNLLKTKWGLQASTETPNFRLSFMKKLKTST